MTQEAIQAIEVINESPSIPYNVIYVIGIFGTLAVSILNLVVNTLNKNKTQFINTVTSSRIKWIGELRTLIAEFSAQYGMTRNNYNRYQEATLSRYNMKVEMLVFSCNEEEKIYKYLTNITSLKNKIILMLNKEDKDDAEIIKHVEKMNDKALISISTTEHFKEINSDIEKFHRLSQKLLKDEWDRVKEESKKGEMKNKMNKD